MRTHHYMGIDPGASGGLALISSDGILVEKMPATPADLWLLVSSWSELADFCYIEKVHSMPGQGVSSTFKFGKNFGLIIGCVTAARIPHDFVPPGVWQKNLGCLTKGDKNVTKQKAQQLYPNMIVTHAIADAILIAEYCRRMRCNG